MPAGGHRRLDPVDIGAAIRGALEAVVPDPDRSVHFDRLNELGGDGSGVPFVHVVPTIAAGGSATVVSWVPPVREPRSFVVGWWHDLDLDTASPTADELSAAWSAVRTSLVRGGAVVPGLGELIGKRSDPLRPGRLALRLRGGQEFRIDMSVAAGYVGPDIKANAAFWGWTA